MTRATTLALTSLHAKLAKVMEDALEGESFEEPILDSNGEDTGRVATVHMPANNPALFTAVAKFLKDNDIVAIPETEDAIAALRKQLEIKGKTTLPKPEVGDAQWPHESRRH